MRFRGTMIRAYYFFILLLFSPICVNASSCKYLKGHHFFIGPEFYSVDRHRAGGTKQHGLLYGGRILYDHLHRYSFYWAVEGAMARGDLTGKSSGKAKLKSTMRDRSIEGRLGYTFEWKRFHRVSLTPFIGIGSLEENNDYKSPSPLHLHFRIAYNYATAGVVSSFYPTECLKIGLNVKVRYLIDPKCKISNDPEFCSSSLKIGNDDLQYRIELPVTYDYGMYNFRCIASKISFVATPFYETRIYGGWMGYPFDFMKTRLNNYGMTLQIKCSWG